MMMVQVRQPPPEVFAHWDTFSGLPEEDIVKIYKDEFKPMNQYELRHLYGFENTQQEDGIVIKNGAFKPRNR